MNLWVKRLGQLTIASVALFFFSCEDESARIGFKTDPKVNVRYVDIPLHTSQVIPLDSIFTDLRPISQGGQTQVVDGILVGHYQDPDLGSITAQPFLTLYPVSNSRLPETAVFDSISIQMRLNFYAYGFTGIRQFDVPVHEITGDTLTLWNGNRYYATSTPPAYSVTPLGTASVVANYDSLRKQASLSSNQQDTLYLRGSLSYEYGERVFNAIRNGFASAAENKEFRNLIRGITLVPPTEAGIFGMNVVNNFGQASRLVVHYHTLTDQGAVDDTLSTSLGFEYAGFTRIEFDRAGTELAGSMPYDALEPPSGRRYIQGGAPAITRLDLNPFYEFADTVENIVVISAEFVIDNVSSPAGLEPHEGLTLRLMRNNANRFLVDSVEADRMIAARYFGNLPPGPHYDAPAEGDAPARVDYVEDDSRFSGFLTLFTQKLFFHKHEEDRLRYVGLVPYNPPVNRAVTRTVFPRENVSLRIYYTRANTATP